MTKTFVLQPEPHPARRNALQAVKEAAVGWRVRIDEMPKTRGQESKYHAMIGDIAGQHKIFGRLWDKEDMKRILVDQFRRDTINDPTLSEFWREMEVVDLCPSLDGRGVVSLGAQTRKFKKPLASAFVEWLYAFGSGAGITWGHNE